MREIPANKHFVAQADLRRVAREAQKVERAKLALHEAILAARASGESLRDIGRAAGLSHARIAQLVKGADDGEHMDH